MDKFEEWFQSQDFYTNLCFIHGDALFLKDSDLYRVLVVRISSEAWQEQQKQIEGRDFTIAAMSRSLVLANAEVVELQAQVEVLKKVEFKWVGDDQYRETRKTAEDCIESGARLTKHRIDL